MGVHTLRAGVAHSLDGDTLWVLHRGVRVWDGASFAPDGEHLSEAAVKEGPIPAATVLQLAKETGAVLRAWGQGLLHMPHSITTDRDGNVWLTDVGLHQVCARAVVQEALVPVVSWLLMLGFSRCRSSSSRRMASS